MTQHANHEASHEIARLRAEVAQWKALYEHAIETRVHYTEERNNARAEAEKYKRLLDEADDKCLDQIERLMRENAELRKRRIVYSPDAKALSDRCEAAERALVDMSQRARIGEDKLHVETALRVAAEEEVDRLTHEIEEDAYRYGQALASYKSRAEAAERRLAMAMKALKNVIYSDMAMFAEDEGRVVSELSEARAALAQIDKLVGGEDG